MCYNDIIERMTDSIIAPRNKSHIDHELRELLARWSNSLQTRGLQRLRCYERPDSKDGVRVRTQ